jgi:alpha-L-rhamnosidase
VVADTAELLVADDAGHFRRRQTGPGRVQQHYVENGTVRSDCVTVYALAIVFGLLDDVMTARPATGRPLVIQNAYRISTGFVRRRT